MTRTLKNNSTVTDILKAKYYRDYSMGFTTEPGYARNLESLKKIEDNYIGQVPISSLNEKDIGRFLISLTSYADCTIERTFKQLKYAFEEAENQGLIESDPIKQYRIRRPKSRKEDGKVYALTEDEQKIFIKALEEYRCSKRNCYKRQLLIELYTGMRMGEINALKPENVDFTNNVIHVTATISRGLNNRKFYRSHPKTDAGFRDVPMNKLVIPIVREAISEMRENRDGLIFWDYNKDEPIATTQVCNFYRRVCLKCGFDHFGQHALRHTFATRCIEAGVEPVVLKTWLGHTNIHITLDTYADVFNRLNNTNIDKFDRYLNYVKLV